MLLFAGARIALWVVLAASTACVAQALQGASFPDAALLSFLVHQAILFALLAVLSGLALGYLAFFAMPPKWRWARGITLAATAIVALVSGGFLLAAEWLTGIGGSPVLAGAVSLYGVCVLDMAAGMRRSLQSAT